jgi:hypothetical protein
MIRMNEGKELLIDVIKSYEEKLSDYEDIKVIINDIDVADTLQKLNDDLSIHTNRIC